MILQNTSKLCKPSNINSIISPRKTCPMSLEKKRYLNLVRKDVIFVFRGLPD